MKRLFTTAKNMTLAAGEAAAFCFRHAPIRYIVQVLSEIISSLLPFAVLIIWRETINALSLYGLTVKAWFWFGAYIVTILLQLAVGAFTAFIDRLFCETVERKCQSLIFEKLRMLDIAKYDDPLFEDAMKVVDEAPAYPYLFNDVLYFVKCIIISVCAVTGITGRYPIGGIAVVLLYLPSIILTARNSVKEYAQYRSEVRDRRKSTYYRNVLTGRDTAAELRLYGYENIFRKKFNALWKKLHKSHVAINQKRTAWEMLGAIVSSLGLVVVVEFVYADIRNGTCTAGDAAMIIGLVLTMMRSIEDTGSSFSCFYNDYLNCTGKLKAFLSLTSSMDKSGRHIPTGVPSIEFRNVSFRYPGKEEYVLKNISFKLEGGEKLALVGVNGAGKTTLTKLLCRLYDPDEGEILIDGINAKDYDIHKLRQLYGVQFQNNRIYKMTIRENIELSDTKKKNESHFQDACLWSGMNTIICKCKNSYDTNITKTFDPDGYEPSGGEKQKIGLARAYYKDSAVMILDEPSSALDAEAEEYIFRQFMEICENKTAVLISHRLSAVSMADKTALIEDGKLLDFGTHKDLMAKNGRYAELYKLQADTYKEGMNHA
ncbi:MAG: ABC transporter ATP-binding protein [Clostridia bacterium]|nr:ABC transporter ATP-binding protein [Clostridia bacterium]